MHFFPSNQNAWTTSFPRRRTPHSYAQTSTTGASVMPPSITHAFAHSQLTPIQTHHFNIVTMLRTLRNQLAERCAYKSAVLEQTQLSLMGPSHGCSKINTKVGVRICSSGTEQSLNGLSWNFHLPTSTQFKTGHYTEWGCFTTLGHNCRRWFPRSLWSKKFI